MLEFRSIAIDSMRSFLKNYSFLEVDTPSLSPNLIPESSIEVFKTAYINPYSKEKTDLFLLPSCELYVKCLIAQHQRSFFQIGKCYRNCESIGEQHSPEFTMIEYYDVGKTYIDAIELTTRLFLFMIDALKDSPILSSSSVEKVKKGFLIKTMDELCIEYAHFSVAKEHSKQALYTHACRLQPELERTAEDMSEGELFDFIFVHSIEPFLPKDRLVLVCDYPYFSSCLAKEKDVQLEDGTFWKVKERWELYGNGLELCNCYTEERDKSKITDYFEREMLLKEKAIVNHPASLYFAKRCELLPECSGVAMGIERLIMFLTNRKRIDSVLPFSCFWN